MLVLCFVNFYTSCHNVSHNGDSFNQLLCIRGTKRVVKSYVWTFYDMLKPTLLCLLVHTTVLKLSLSVLEKIICAFFIKLYNLWFSKVNRIWYEPSTQNTYVKLIQNYNAAFRIKVWYYKHQKSLLFMQTSCVTF